MSVNILGIRHHGPGSAKNVKAFLGQNKPDIVLVEGPPEADEILQWANHKELKPPVAILCYQPDNPKLSSFYPFAEFSPEWQAISYARKNKIPVRFMDLPACHQFAIEEEKRKEAEEAAAKTAETNDNNDIKEILNNGRLLNSDIQLNGASPIQLRKHSRRWLHNNDAGDPEIKEDAEVGLYTDPIAHLAKAAGYADGEKWWEHMFEHRMNDEAVFEAVMESMQILREVFPRKDDRMERLREAHMRKTIRQAEKEMFQNIAVICGAWHAPALEDMPKAKEDNDLLKGLPKVKIECTWIPWTYRRLSFYSGYGAGIASPGWYRHIWKYPKDNGTRWVAKVARLFREHNMDTSVAHVVEAVRLAESLAALRALSKAGLEELNDAVVSVLCNGENILMSLVHDQLIVSNAIGEVPADIPRPPLQLDIDKLQKKLRLPASADWKDYTLDLRKDTDLQRSVFLHRMQLLQIQWGNKQDIGGKGTFKELWRLQWTPEFSIDIIDKGNWGNTVEEAASKFVIDQAGNAAGLKHVCELLEQTLAAELPQAVDVLIQQINNLSAATGDVIQLMEVIPSLVSVSRYGNVRKTDATLVTGILESMISRICVSLPAACTSVNEDAAAHLLELFYKMNDAVNVLQMHDILAEWHQTLHAISGNVQAAPVLAGYATRLLSDHKILEGDGLLRAFYLSMSPAVSPAVAASWLEGFLKGSGTLLLVDNDLWTVINSWVQHLDDENFMHVLPLLRRTFSNFTATERRKIGEKAKGGGVSVSKKETTAFDEKRAAQSIPVVMELFGYGGRNV